MKRLLMTTALFALTSAVALAETPAQTGLMVDDAVQTTNDMRISADSLLGKTVYIGDAATDADLDWTTYTNLPDGWTDAGDMSDIITVPNGRLGSVVIDVGGFLGVEERNVTFAITGIDLMQDKNGRVRGFVSKTKEQVESMDEWTGKS